MKILTIILFLALSSVVLAQEKGFVNLDGQFFNTCNVKNNINGTLDYYEILPTILIPLSNISIADSNEIKNENVGKILVLSVLRYKNKIIDICPITIEDKRLPTSFTHSFKKNTIPIELVLDLISNYEWKIEGDIVSKNFYPSLKNDFKYPKEIESTFEAVKLK